MPIDASIPLQVKPPQFMNPMQAMSLQQLALQSQQAQQDMADKNELRNVGRNYSDEQGQITPEGLKRISNPMVRNQLLQQQQQMIAQGIAAKLSQLNLSEKQNELLSEGLVGIYGDFERTKSSLPPEEAANRFSGMLRAKTDELRKSGLFSPEQLSALERVQSPQDALALLSGTKAYKAYRAETAPKITTVKPGASIVSTDPTSGETKPIYTAPDADKGAWSEPYQMGGAFVQKNSKTGEIRQAVSRPPQTTVNMPKLHYDPDLGGVVDLNSGEVKPVTSGGKPVAPKLNSAQQHEITKIDQQMQTVDGALEAVKSTPGAFSFTRGTATRMGATAESLAGRTDSEAESTARSYVFNVVSKVINERAGAAQSAQELARLRSFLPAEQDNAQQIKNKLDGFKKYLNDMRAGTLKTSRTAAPATTPNVMRFDAQGNLIP